MHQISSKGQLIGYVRVSSIDQNPERQLEGQTIDKTYIDKASGKDIDRPQLQALLDYAREGDTIIVHSMDRLARNLDHLRKLVKLFTNKGIKVQFVKESLTFTGEDSPMANLLLSVMGAFGEFERSLIRERQLEGIALAKQRGVYNQGKGRKPKLNAEQIQELKRRVESKEPKASIARGLKISRYALYNYMKKD